MFLMFLSKGVVAAISWWFSALTFGIFLCGWSFSLIAGFPKFFGSLSYLRLSAADFLYLVVSVLGLAEGLYGYCLFWLDRLVLGVLAVSLALWLFLAFGCVGVAGGCFLYFAAIGLFLLRYNGLSNWSLYKLDNCRLFWLSIGDVHAVEWNRRFLSWILIFVPL
ncbi:hypothetical protein MA16_Dca020373 [Dendrobium catenatum]|uniref:Uncharacterized protein n=1 Tax=Dendrobium catenatum TaxID=906689 RepID=A0A2I0VMV7_9ASPA|nr:hypothetical protein MA16_Dca020373 [Dendrobium catenatum]